MQILVEKFTVKMTILEGESSEKDEIGKAITQE